MSQPSQDGPKWFTYLPDPVEEGETAETASLSFPSGAPMPQVRLSLKTRVRKLKCSTKTYAPRVFDGKIGASRKVAHHTHRLWQARGLVWCCKCGQVGTLKPKGLLIKCPEKPSPFGLRTLERIARGFPPPYTSSTGPALIRARLGAFGLRTRLTNLGPRPAAHRPMQRMVRQRLNPPLLRPLRLESRGGRAAPLQNLARGVAKRQTPGWRTASISRSSPCRNMPGP